MPERRPLVIGDEGKTEELQFGDTLPGVSTGGSGGNVPVCLTDGTTLFPIPVTSGLPVCLTDGTTIFSIPLV